MGREKRSLQKESYSYWADLDGAPGPGCAGNGGGDYPGRKGDESINAAAPCADGVFILSTPGSPSSTVLPFWGSSVGVRGNPNPRGRARCLPRSVSAAAEAASAGGEGIGSVHPLVSVDLEAAGGFSVCI